MTILSFSGLDIFKISFNSKIKQFRSLSIVSCRTYVFVSGEEFYSYVSIEPFCSISRCSECISYHLWRKLHISISFIAESVECVSVCYSCDFNRWSSSHSVSLYFHDYFLSSCRVCIGIKVKHIPELEVQVFFKDSYCSSCDW